MPSSESSKAFRVLQMRPSSLTPMPLAPTILPKSPNISRVISQAVMIKRISLLGWVWTTSNIFSPM